MQLTQKKRQRTDLLTVAAVAALFVVMAALLYTGHLTRQVTNMLVPVAVYIVMAVSLNLVVGLLGELSLGHAGFMSLGAYGSAVITTLVFKGTSVAPAAQAWPPPPNRRQTSVALTRSPVRRENFQTPSPSSRMVTAQSTPWIWGPKAERSSASLSVA